MIDTTTVYVCPIDGCNTMNLSPSWCTAHTRKTSGGAALHAVVPLTALEMEVAAIPAQPISDGATRLKRIPDDLVT